MEQEKYLERCFTPEVSLLTFFVEFFLATYILLRHRLSKFAMITAIMILLLSAFQFSEFALCRVGDSAFWSKAGIASITMLPVLALHMVSMMTRKSVLVEIGYVLGALAIVMLVTYPVELNSECTGNFVVFRALPGYYETAYSLYYFFYLFAGIFMLYSGIRERRGDKALLQWMMISYLLFMVPAFVLFLVTESTRSGVPSIMCGFAVLAAIVWAFKVVPQHQKSRLKDG